MLWLHAAFLLNVRPEAISKSSAWLHLTSVELIFFLLLTLFSFVAGSGFWSGAANVAYIYFFPFVLFFYIIIGLFHVLRRLGFFGERPAHLAAVSSPTTSLPTKAEGPSVRERTNNTAAVLLRPFNRFTVLWCLLLLAATHIAILWAALVIVLIHLLRSAARILRLSWISESRFGEIEAKFQQVVDEDLLPKLQAVTRESPADPALKNLWNMFQSYEKIFKFVQDENLVSKWAVLIGSVVFGSTYLYLAFLFSFAYYGAAQVTLAPAASWSEYFVTALFIPFFATDLPRNMFIRLLAGSHCVLVLVLGIGGVVTYMRRRIKSITRMATVITVKMSDEKVREKKLILQEKFSSTDTKPE